MVYSTIVKTMYDFPANIHVRLLAILCVTFSCVCHFPIRFPGSGVVCDQLMLQTARSATETSLKIKNIHVSSAANTLSSE